jgi:hypothetical protein
MADILRQHRTNGFRQDLRDGTVRTRPRLVAADNPLFRAGRAFFKQSVEHELPKPLVLSVREITNDIGIEQLGELRI